MLRGVAYIAAILILVFVAVGLLGYVMLRTQDEEGMPPITELLPFLWSDLQEDAADIQRGAADLRSTVDRAWHGASPFGWDISGAGCSLIDILLQECPSR